MLSKTVVLISCSKVKRNYPCAARLLYDASRLFSKSLAYAQKITEDVYVLSSKYGLVPLDEVIAPYDETLNDKSAEELAAWGKWKAGQISERYDVRNTVFIILAGQNYYKPLRTYLPQIKLPLIGLPIGERLAKLDELLAISPTEQESMCHRLHKLFNAMPRYKWNTIDEIGFDSGIYIVFENGETYNSMDRIVRVGTHRSDGRLRARLKDHLVAENKDGSIFRKNIGRAILNKNNNGYLSVWNVDTSKKDTTIGLNGYDAAFQRKVEATVSEYMREHFSFVCFPVASKDERLRLEEGIIATLNRASDFQASPSWRGKHSPEYEIAQSGMWLKQGLDGTPLSENEYAAIEMSCSGNAHTKMQTSESAPPVVGTGPVEIRTADVVRYISNKLSKAKLTEAKSVIIVSGDVHKEMGLVSRMPTVCGAMRKLMKSGDKTHYAPPSGNGATLRIEYFL